MPFHLVLIETSGNQNYIFATNKLRENVGASELTYRAGTQWVLEAVEEVGGPALWVESSAQLRMNLTNEDLNPPIEKRLKSVEVILAASGKAMLLVEQESLGKEIIQLVTQRALEKAPGLDICGVISRGFDSDKMIEDDGVQVPILSVINREIQDQFEAARVHRPGPVMRFFRLPCVAECSTSGLPASQWDKTNLNDQERQRREEPQARSQVSLKKREKYPVYRERMKDTFGFDFAHDITELEEHCDWLAIVHCDGNGLGKIFQNFGRYTEAASHRDLADKLRRFSLALDECAESAFKQAIEKLPKYKRRNKERVSLVPIVLGGDDMTVVCDGRAALQFTSEFLTSFEQATAGSESLKRIAKTDLPEKRLSACAGVSVVKPHYPFSGAYDLAEKLIESAKQVKKIVVNPNDRKLPWPCSALDFHILYDASGSDLKPIRRRLEFKGIRTRLYGRPYIVTPEQWLDGAAEDGRRWAAQHLWDKLGASVEVVVAKDEDGRRRLPNNQLHDLRTGLFLEDRDAADARFRLIRNRYVDEGIKQLCGDGEHTLFVKDVKPRKEWDVEYFTRLLDVMDAASLWPDGEKL